MKEKYYEEMMRIDIEMIFTCFGITRKNKKLEKQKNSDMLALGMVYGEEWSND